MRGLRRALRRAQGLALLFSGVPVARREAPLSRPQGPPHPQLTRPTHQSAGPPSRAGQLRLPHRPADPSAVLIGWELQAKGRRCPGRDMRRTRAGLGGLIETDGRLVST